MTHCKFDPVLWTVEELYNAASRDCTKIAINTWLNVHKTRSRYGCLTTGVFVRIHAQSNALYRQAMRMSVAFRSERRSLWEMLDIRVPPADCDRPRHNPRPSLRVAHLPREEATDY